MLTLTIKKKWYDMILAGIKKEEYREIKDYYDSRLLTMFGAIMVDGQLLQGEAVPEEIRRAAVQPVIFRNGYGRNCPQFLAYCTLAVKEGRQEWGAEPGVQYYTLEIREVKEDRNGQAPGGSYPAAETLGKHQQAAKEKAK